jgi:hypothetical protein
MHAGNYKCVQYLLRTPEGTISLMRFVCSCEDNIKENFRKKQEVSIELDSSLRLTASLNFVHRLEF